MKRTRIGLILGLVLIVGAVFFVLSDRKTSLWSSDADFALRDTAQIVRVFMADKNGGKVLLERSAPHMPWQLNDSMTAEPKIVKMLLSTMHNLEIKYPVPQKAYNSVVKDLASSAIKVEIYTHSHRITLGSIKLLPYTKKARVFYVGAATADNMGTFMIMEGSDKPYVVDMPGFRGFVAARFTTEPQDWLSHQFINIHYTQIGSIHISSLSDNSRNYSIQKLTKDYELRNSLNNTTISPYDTAALYSYLDGFKNINFELDLTTKLSTHQIDSILQVAPPLYQIDIQETLGKKYSIQTFKKAKGDIEAEAPMVFDKDRLYALVDGKLLLVQYMSIAQLVRPIEYFYNTTTP